MSQYKIIQFAPQYIGKYNLFLSEHKNALFYHSISFKNFLEHTLNCQSEYYLLIEKEKIRGVLPLFKKPGKYGLVYNSLPYYGSIGGILYSNNDSKNQLIEFYNTLISKPNVAASTMITSPFEGFVDSIKHNILDSRISLITNLSTKDFCSSFINNIKGPLRRNIKKALKSGFEIKTDQENIDFLFQTHKDNMKNIGGKYRNYDFFSNLELFFERDKEFNIYSVYKNEKPIASLLIFYSNNIVEYSVPVIDHDYRSQQPLSLAIYTAMLESSKKNYKYWNWGGTWHSQEGVYKFKKKWIPVENKYWYYIWVNNPEIYSASAHQLQKEYGDFYVIPYEKLNHKE